MVQTALFKKLKAEHQNYTLQRNESLKNFMPVKIGKNNFKIPQNLISFISHSSIARKPKPSDFYHL